jgi:hypothetical protein
MREKNQFEIPKDKIEAFCRKHHIRKLSLFGAGILSVNGLINPSTFPGLKPGVCSELILSGAFHSILKDGVWRCRSIKTRG